MLFEQDVCYLHCLYNVSASTADYEHAARVQVVETLEVNIFAYRPVKTENVTILTQSDCIVVLRAKRQRCHYHGCIGTKWVGSSQVSERRAYPEHSSRKRNSVCRRALAHHLS